MTQLVFRDKFPYEYHNYLDKLEDQERKVVVSFYGLAGKTRLKIEEIAEVFRDPGIDTSKIRNILSLAMGKLRDAHEQEKLRKFNKGESKDGVARD